MLKRLLEKLFPKTIKEIKERAISSVVLKIDINDKSVTCVNLYILRTWDSMGFMQPEYLRKSIIKTMTIALNEQAIRLNFTEDK